MMSTNDVFTINVYQMPYHSLRVWAAGDKTRVCVYVCDYIYVHVWVTCLCISMCEIVCITHSSKKTLFHYNNLLYISGIE